MVLKATFSFLAGRAAKPWRLLPGIQPFIDRLFERGLLTLGIPDGL